jgi:transposase
MLSMLKRHEVQVLLSAKHTQAEVARLAGISERSVRRIASEAPVIHVDDAAARHETGVGRPNQVEDFRKFLAETLEKEPRLKTVELLHRARQAGYGGGKSAVYELVARIRPRYVAFEMRFEGLPGEFTQHDFGEVDVSFTDGSIQRIHFFASRLKFSRWAEVSLVPDQKAETLVRAVVDHFAAMGGIPLLAVFDRPRTIASKWRRDGTVTEWNPTFAAAMFELGLGVELCWPYSPEQKGAVENLVGWVKGSFFKQRRFHDHADLRQQLGEWLEETNNDRPSRATNVAPAARIEQDRARLRPLRVAPDQFALRVPIHVGPTAEVVHDSNAYSMPPDAAGLAGTLFLYRDRLRIVAGRFEAEHSRKKGRNEKSILPEHRAARLATMAGQRGRRYLKRQHIFEVGPAAVDYLSEIVHRRPRSWSDDVDQLHDLLQVHGPAALHHAIERALAARTYGAEYVAHFLQQSLLDLAEALV